MVQFDEIQCWHKDQDEKEKTQNVKTEISDKQAEKRLKNLKEKRALVATKAAIWIKNPNQNKYFKTSFVHFCLIHFCFKSRNLYCLEVTLKSPNNVWLCDLRC